MSVRSDAPRRGPVSYTLAFSAGEYVAIRAAARADRARSVRAWMIDTLVRVASAPDLARGALERLTSTTPKEPDHGKVPE